MLVTGAGGGVDDEVIQLAPLDVLEELLDQAVLLGAAPDDGVVAVGKHELDAHDCQVFRNPNGTPAGVAHVYRLLLDTHHLGDAGPADVRVHDADLGFGVGGEGVGEHGGEGGFADSALAAQNEDLVLDGREAGGDERDVGIGAFGGGGADLLIGTAGTGITLAGVLRLRAGTVFCSGSGVSDEASDWWQATYRARAPPALAQP